MCVTYFTVFLMTVECSTTHESALPLTDGIQCVPYFPCSQAHSAESVHGDLLQVHTLDTAVPDGMLCTCENPSAI